MGKTTVNTIINTEKTDDDIAVNTTVGAKECTTCSFKGKQSVMSREELWKIWKQLNKNRALEISTLWQRSVFLSAFIVLVLTGSGIFYKEVVLFGFLQTIPMKSSLTGIFLGLLVYVSGILWLGMSKGSKYWFEVYERKIDLLEDLLSVHTQFKYLNEKYLGETEKTAIDGRQYMLNKELVSSSGWFWLKADKVSPSKINIFIGWLIIVIGFLYFGFFQIIYWLRIFCWPCIFNTNTEQTIGCLASVVMFLMIVITSILLYKQLRHRN